MAKSILIGDAGGTKTAWRLIQGGQITQYNTSGFNAFTHSVSDFKRSIAENDLPKEVDEVVLYCAGADTVAQREEVAEELMEVFNAKVVVENDLLGSARATCGRESGYACILGTGANASFYDGAQVAKVSASLGYVLGDEGSGAYLGKLLLRGIYRERLSALVTEDFQKQFNLPVDEAIRTIYGSSKPNQYLASFVPFILEHKKDASVYALITEAFSDFFSAFFNAEPVKEKVHFTGSVAFYFSDILRQVAMDLDFTVGTIIDSPIAGLVLFHRRDE